MGRKVLRGIPEADRREIAHGIHVVGGQVHSLVVQAALGQVTVLEEEPSEPGTPAEKSQQASES
ncbi:MAG: hypothetical protein V1798_01995 [Pseudomonadota bacterium]